MEYNGILFDEDRSLELGALLEEEVRLLDEELAKTFSIDGFNFNSKDHLSCLLYGGRITIPKKEVIGIYKTGERKGQVKEGWVDHHYDMPRLIEPLKGSELKKDGYYSTDEQTLRSLRVTGVSKGVVQLILKRSGLEKRRGTYYSGLPELRENQGWSKGTLHGQLNQCVARTGRLSSSKPNLQNFDGEIKELFYSRY
jgi:DNA polymerase I-like protein with 3'-5' exonuclease and polymerase domains